MITIRCRFTPPMVSTRDTSIISNLMDACLDSRCSIIVLGRVPGLYKMVLNKQLNLKDPEAVDYKLYKGLTWILCVRIPLRFVVLPDAA